MKRILCILVFTFVFLITGFSQETVPASERRIADSIHEVRRDSVSKKTYRVLINKIFGTIATGQDDEVNLSNYGSFDPVNGAYKLNLYGHLGNPKVKKDKKIKQWFFNISSSGTLTGDNVGILFNDSKFNSGFNVTGKLHIPIPTRFNSVIVGETTLDTVSQKIRKLEFERSLANNKIRYALDTNTLNYQLQLLKGSLATIQLNKAKSIVHIDSLTGGFHVL